MTEAISRSKNDTEPRNDRYDEAQRAMAAALVIAAAAEAQVRTGATAHLVGRISLQDFRDFAASMILRAMSHARLIGAFFAGREWGAGGRPPVITEQDQRHIRAAIGTITETSSAPGPDGPVSNEEPEPLPDRGEEPELVMRTTRLAHAETVSEGRRAYASATADALGDVHHFWRFQPSPDACARCTELASKRFDEYEDAPQGAHPSCECVLIAELED